MLSVTETSVYTRSVSAAGVATNTEHTFAANASMAALVTAIDLISGWDATLITDGPSDDLNPLAGQDAKDATVYLTYPAQDAQVATIDYDAGIISVEREYWEWAQTNRQFGWPVGFRNVLAEYRGGFESVASATATADLQLLCQQVVADLFAESRAPGSFASESLGDYSYSREDWDKTLARYEKRLAPWRRQRFGRRVA